MALVFRRLFKLGKLASTGQITISVRHVQLTTHQWIQAYLVKYFCWFSREGFELQISPIPIFAYLFQGLSNGQIKFSLRPTQQLTLDKFACKLWFWAIFLTDNKTFDFEKFWIFFWLIVCSFRHLLWTIKKYFRISSKNGHQSMDSLYSISSKYWATYKLLNIGLEWNIFQNFINPGFLFHSASINGQHTANCWCCAERSVTM